jgi:hypothetical protein
MRMFWNQGVPPLMVLSQIIGASFRYPLETLIP